MEKTIAENEVQTETTPVGGSSFNFNKLQAVLCMASSAAVSIGLIAWAVHSLL